MGQHIVRLTGYFGSDHASKMEPDEFLTGPRCSVVG
jgi:hypothetical protein